MVGLCGYPSRETLLKLPAAALDLDPDEQAQIVAIAEESDEARRTRRG
ncbi:hypothetical protein BH23CHL10_BH23CHL10_08680 [soil metagenome]